MSAMTRRQMLRTVGLGAAAGLCGARAAAEPRKPNIIFILADDLGYGDLGCYGQDVVKTPCIDQMASEGMRFTDCYAGSTVCAPSRCCLMTGLHTGHAYIRGNRRLPLPPEQVTVAERLKQAGYATGIIGKWGLGNEGTTGVPTRQGFDYWFGYLDQGHAHNYYPDHLWRNEEKVLYPENVQHPDCDGVAIERKTYSHDLFAREALDFVERHQREPFFLYLAYTIPHANNEGGRCTGDGMEVPDYGAYAGRDWEDPQKGHAAMITRLDKDVGELLTTLAELGIDEDTLVFFTSDNGPHKEGGADPAFFGSSGPLKGYKRDLYEGGIRVPMIARWPGHITPDTTNATPWAFWDFLPTALDVAGAAAPEGVDGISVLPALLEGKELTHPPLYWEFYERGFSRAVRKGPWKGVQRGLDKPMELYDLRVDIGEENNLAAARPELAKELEAILDASRTAMKEWPLPKR